ncbi:MAG: hypothetical protein ABT940_00695 [Alphaproteobacteria bacterium]
MTMPPGAGKNWRDFGIFTLFMVAGGLAGCSVVPDWITPPSWRQEARDSGAGAGGGGGASGESGNAASDEDQARIRSLGRLPGAAARAEGEGEFPNLGSVPDRAPPRLSRGTREDMIKGLVADREHAQYHDEEISEGEPPSPVTAPAAESSPVNRLAERGETPPEPVVARASSVPEVDARLPAPADPADVAPPPARKDDLPPVLAAAETPPPAPSAPVVDEPAPAPDMAARPLPEKLLPKGAPEPMRQVASLVPPRPTVVPKPAALPEPFEFETVVITGKTHPKRGRSLAVNQKSRSATKRPAVEVDEQQLNLLGGSVPFGGGY